MNFILVTVLAAVILSLSMGLRQSLGLFLQPMNVELAVSASAFGFAMALQNIVWGVSQPFIGMLADRYGARPVLMVFALVYAAGLLLMAGAQPAIGLDAGTGLLVGVGVAGTSFGVLLGAVARAAPPARRSQVVGVVSALGSVGTLILAPLGQVLIHRYGWQFALVVFAAIAASCAVIAIGIGREANVQQSAAADPGFSSSKALLAAVRHRGYVAMTVAFFACGFQLLFVATHLPQFLATCGIAPTVSAAALGLIGLGNAVGSWLGGVLGARYSHRRIIAVIYLLRTLAIAVYVSLPITAWSTLIFATVIGLLWFSVMPPLTGLIGSLFGLRYFSTLFGLTFLSHQLGSFAGAWLGGVTFDLTGSYASAWTALIAVGIVATLLQWFMDDRPAPAPRQGPASVAVA